MSVADPSLDAHNERQPAGRTRRGAASNGYLLLTFGRLALLNPAGLEEPSLTTRRRKLALLAYLVLRRQPVPRPVLMDLFWGEREEERARKSLSDALSHLRRVMGHSLIATYATEIAVSPEAAPAVDALELERAALAGDHEQVLALYEGPFLQGVFVEDSSAFEDWSSRERRRFEDLFVAASAAMCRKHSAAADWTACEKVAERWLQLRPESADAATQLLGALAADGSHEGRLRALAAYDRIAARLTREFDLHPEPAVRKLAGDIRKAVQTAGRPSDPSIARETRAAATVPARAPASSQEVSARTPVSPPPADQREGEPAVPAGSADEERGERSTTALGRRRSPFIMAGAAALVVAATLATLEIRANRDASAPLSAASTSTRRPTVAIAPFLTAADDSTSVWLSEALPGLIAAKLAHFGQIEIVPAEQMRGASADPVAGARPFEAAIIASGAVTRRDSVLTLDLALHASDRRLLARHALSGTNVVAVANLAAVRVLNAADVMTEGATLGELETSSVEAYRHYHLATRAAMNSNAAEAIRQLDAAIALDSGFSAALLERYRMAVDLGEPVVSARLRPALRRARERMSEGDRLRFDAEEALFAGDQTRSEFLVRTLVQRYPHNVRAHAAYIAVFASHGNFPEVERAYQRVLSLVDSGAGPEQRTLWCGHLSGRAEQRRVSGNTAGAVADWRLVTDYCPDVAGVWSRFSWALLSAGNLEEAERAADRARVLAGNEDRWLVGHLLLRQRRWEAVDSAVRLWLRQGPAEARGDALDIQSAALRERGRYREAIALELRGRTDGGFWLPQVHVDNLGRAGEFDRLRRFRGEFLPDARGVIGLTGDTLLLRGEGARGWVWHRALYGDAIMRAGDTATVRALADSLPVVGRRSYYARDWRVHHHLRGLLAARAGRHEEAIREFRAALWGPSGWTRTNVEMARSYLALGRPGEAVAILRPAYAANVYAMGRYAPLSELDYFMTLSFRALGQRDSAAVYEGYVRRSWARADTVIAPLLHALGPNGEESSKRR